MGERYTYRDLAEHGMLSAYLACINKIRADCADAEEDMFALFMLYATRTERSKGEDWRLTVARLLREAKRLMDRASDVMSAEMDGMYPQEPIEDADRPDPMTVPESRNKFMTYFRMFDAGEWRGERWTRWRSASSAPSPTAPGPAYPRASSCSGRDGIPSTGPRRS